MGRVEASSSDQTSLAADGGAQPVGCRRAQGTSRGTLVPADGRGVDRADALVRARWQTIFTHALLSVVGAVRRDPGPMTAQNGEDDEDEQADDDLGRPRQPEHTGTGELRRMAPGRRP